MHPLTPLSRLKEMVTILKTWEQHPTQGTAVKNHSSEWRVTTTGEPKQNKDPLAQVIARLRHRFGHQFQQVREPAVLRKQDAVLLVQLMYM
jgi:hypothetical protein